MILNKRETIKIAGEDVLLNVVAPFALSGIFGIGVVKANEILLKIGIRPTKRISELSEHEISEIDSYIRDKCLIGIALKRKIDNDIRNKKEMGQTGTSEGYKHILLEKSKAQRKESKSKRKVQRMKK